MCVCARARARVWSIALWKEECRGVEMVCNSHPLGAPPPEGVWSLPARQCVKPRVAGPLHGPFYILMQRAVGRLQTVFGHCRAHCTGA